MWFNTEAEYVAVKCECPDHNGRELRLWTGIPHRDTIAANQTAIHNAAVTAARMPFAFTANSGVVFADRIGA